MPTGEEAMILPQARVKVGQELDRLGAVPQFQEEVKLRGDGTAVMDKGRVALSGLGHIGVERVNCPPHIEFQ